jgi:hypothetical protein
VKEDGYQEADGELVEVGARVVSAPVEGCELGLEDESAELPEVPMALIWPGDKKGVAPSSWIN